jgi:prepilin-type N-terminal cleavage/methylation domain-containing protein
MQKKQKGFTLIELLVVIAIIGLLSTLAVVSLNNARSKSRDARRVSDIKQIQTALELYYNDCNGYPATADVAEGDNIAGDDTECSSGVTYMGIVPTAPTPDDGACTAAENSYSYTQVGSSPYTSYTITYCIGADTGGLDADAGERTASPSSL